MRTLPDSIRTEGHGLRTLYLCEGIEADAVLEALQTPGEMLKDGDKRIVRKVGDWVIKESRFNKGVGPLKMTTNPQRYRNGWLSSLEMMRLGLPVPKTIAYVEHHLCGVIWRSTFIYEYIPEALPLNEYLHSLNDAGKDQAPEPFFQGLAAALHQLAQARVLHRDLKPLNVLTANGKDFYFIDLDEAFLDHDFLPEHRLRNQVQLLDGMRTAWTREQYNDFLEASIPAGEEVESWKKRVWEIVDERADSGKFY